MENDEKMRERRLQKLSRLNTQLERFFKKLGWQGYGIAALLVLIVGLLGVLHNQDLKKRHPVSFWLWTDNTGVSVGADVAAPEDFYLFSACEFEVKKIITPTPTLTPPPPIAIVQLSLIYRDDMNKPQVAAWSEENDLEAERFLEAKKGMITLHVKENTETEPCRLTIISSPSPH